MSTKTKAQGAKGKAKSKAKTVKVPSLRLHKPSNRGFVELEGKRHYLGGWDKAETLEAYNRLIAQWIENGRRLPSIPKDITVAELILEYWRFSESYYRRPDGKPTGELEAIRKALQPARELYASIPASEFSPKCLKVVRDTMIGKGWTRKNINNQVGRIKRMFRWGVEEEMIGGDVFHALQAVAGLKYGRCEAKESKPVQPVPHAHVDAVLPYLGRQVAAMVQLQRLTGMRPGEVCDMRPCDVVTTGDVWVYRPAHHKTSHHGHERRIYLNAVAQAVLRPFLLRDAQAHCFSPIEAEAERRAAQHAERKTPMSCGNIPGSNRKDDPARTPGTCYDTLAYGHAVTRAIAKANKERDANNKIPAWTPHKLRHTFATDVRASLGLENAQVLLGHARADVTQVYAAVNERAAIEAIKRMGK